MCNHLGDLGFTLWICTYLFIKLKCKVKSMMSHVYMKLLHASGMRMNVYPCIGYACAKAF